MLQFFLTKSWSVAQMISLVQVEFSSWTSLLPLDQQNRAMAIVDDMRRASGGAGHQGIPNTYGWAKESSSDEDKE